MKGMFLQTIKAASLVSACAVCGVASAVTSDGGRLMMDGCVFDLMMLNPTTTGAVLGLEDLKNRMDWSAESPFAWLARSACSDQATLTMCGVPEPMIITNLEVSSDMYLSVTNTYACLHLPQSVKAIVGEDLATTNYFQFPNVVIADEPVKTGGDMTLFAKFRWSGNLTHPVVENYGCSIIENARDFGGFGLAVTVLDPKIENRVGYISFAAAGDSYRLFDYSFPVETNRWMSLAVVVKALPCGDSLVTAYCPLREAETVRFIESAYTITGKQIRYPQPKVAWQDDLVLGASGGMRGNLDGFDRWRAFSQFSLFRGDIAKLQVYDRALSREEVYMLCADSSGNGVGFRIGSVNGRADEFSVAGESTCEDVFEPKSMPPDRFLKGLDADHPSVTIRFPLPASEIGLPKVLLLDALPEGVGASAPAEVLVNGLHAATIDFCQTNRYAAFLRKRVMRRDGEGNVTLSVVRKGLLAGTVKFDCLELAGSWRAGLLDGLVDADVFAPASQLQNTQGGFQVLGGGGGFRYLMDCLLGLRADKVTSYYPSTAIVFSVPDAIATMCASRFSMKLTNTASDVREISISVNGSEKLHKKGLSEQDLLTVDFSPGFLNPGVNTLVISNATCDFVAEPGSSDYYDLKFDSLSYEFKPPSDGGLLMLIR